jgi:lipoyl(octanoyl) transferase
MANKQPVHFSDWGSIAYEDAWKRQEWLLEQNVNIKSEYRNKELPVEALQVPTQHHLIFCEHPPVYTLGKSGDISHVLLSDDDLHTRGIQFFKTNRGGDITFHGPDQIVGYPIFDLEKFTTDIGKYLRNLEEIVIRTLADFHLVGQRSEGETGVWLDADKPGHERKICAIGVRCSRWITMHGFAFNVNTDLDYFSNIIPCGIRDKKVTSLKAELGGAVDLDIVKNRLRIHFEEVFEIELC